MEEQRTHVFRGPYLQGHTDATMVQNLRCCKRYTPGRLRTPAGQPLPLLPWHNDNNNNKNPAQQQQQLIFIECFPLLALVLNAAYIVSGLTFVKTFPGKHSFPFRHKRIAIWREDKIWPAAAEGKLHSEPLPVLLPEGSHLSGCRHDNQKGLDASSNIPASLHGPASMTLKGITRSESSHKIRNPEANSPLIT